MFVINRDFRKVGFLAGTHETRQLPVRQSTTIYPKPEKEAWLLDGVEGEDAWMDDGETEPVRKTT